jgi:hypothetical protein
MVDTLGKYSMIEDHLVPFPQKEQRVPTRSLEQQPKNDRDEICILSSSFIPVSNTQPPHRHSPFPAVRRRESCLPGPEPYH